MSFAASLSSDLIPVEPGSTVPLSFEVANRSDEPDRFEVEIEGIDPEWTAVPVPIFTVQAGEVQQEKVFFKPPRACESLGGNYPYVLKIRSLNSGELRTVQGVLQIKQYHHLSMEISPKKGFFSTARKINDFEITLMNLGNTEHTVQLFGNDPEEDCAFEFEHDQVTLSPGQQKTIKLIVTPTSSPIFASGRLFGFMVSARSIEVPTVMTSAQAQLEVKPLMNPSMLVLFLIMAIVGGLWLYFLPKPPTIQLSVDKASVQVGDPIQIAYTAANATDVQITINDEAQAIPSDGTGQISYTPKAAGNLHIVGIAVRDRKTSRASTADVTVTERPSIPEPEITVFKISPKEVNKGELITITYKFNEAVKQAILQPSGQSLVVSGEQLQTQVRAETVGDVEFAIVATNEAGKSIRKKGIVKVTEKSDAVILTFTADPTSLPPLGGDVIVNWQISNAEAAQIIDTEGKTIFLPDIKGSLAVSVKKSGQITLVGIDSKGLKVKEFKTIKVEKVETEPPTEEPPLPNEITVKPGGG